MISEWLHCVPGALLKRLFGSTLLQRGVKSPESSGGDNPNPKAYGGEPGYVCGGQASELQLAKSIL